MDVNETDPGGHSARFAAVFSAEQNIIEAQRRNRQQPEDARRLAGIAISGGGIRSASFALGVLQALQRAEVLKRFDYLSTVSGGGYIGSSWTWFNHLVSTGRLNAPSGFFPFGIPGEGARGGSDHLAMLILNFLRQHCSYLIPGHGLNVVSAMTVVLRNMVLPVLVYFLLMVCLFTGVIGFEAITPGLPDHSDGVNLPLVVAGSALGLVVAINLLFGPLSRIMVAGSAHAYALRTRVQQLTGIIAIVGISALYIGLLPVFIKEAHHAVVGASGGFLGAAGAVWQFVSRTPSKLNGLLSSVVPVISALLVITGMASVAWYVAAQGWISWTLALPVALALGWFVNINQFGLGRMYRDRLMETFLPDPDAILQGRWRPARDATVTRLADVCTASDTGPYHLINTNLILTDDDDKRFRARGGDNFLMSSQYCGSDATGWVPTTQFDDGRLTLPTAMATSGAAVNPDAAPNSLGLTRNPLISFLMFTLGLRLGLYAANPNYPATRKLMSPNLIIPGLLQGLLGRYFNTDSRFLALSDGGHFDNTAAYELIRRRLDLIVISEAGQDQQFSFADVANLVEKVRVDFGVKIDFDTERGLDGLMPGSLADATDPMVQKFGLACRGYAIATIDYPASELGPAKKGQLVLVKATLTEGLPADIYGYRDTHTSFPNQTTLDQFFDEPQFEAYRELGYQLAKQTTANGSGVNWGRDGDNT